MKMPTWYELPEGAAIKDPMNSEALKTGDWRVFKPVIIDEKCIRCRLCWIFCPDSAILEIDDPNAKMGKRYEVDYDHCKGCGICYHECPTKAIEWVPEVK